MFEEVLSLDVVDGGVRFDPASLEVAPIREDQEYGGIRVTLRAQIATAQVRLRLDLGFGDAITPGPELVEFPSSSTSTPPRMRAYPRPTAGPRSSRRW